MLTVRFLSQSRRSLGRRGVKLAVAAIVASAVGYGTSELASNRQSAAPIATLPTGPTEALQVAGSLVVSPSGALYVADDKGDRILVHMPAGTFRDVAGDGTTGFSGDGGPAVRAELDAPADLAYGAAGLYFVDGGRVRLIEPDGVLRTLAGNGEYQVLDANGEPRTPIVAGDNALSVSLGSSPTIALGPSGIPYISTGQQLLRLSSAATFVPLRALVESGPLRGPARDMGPIAVDARGDIDISCIVGWSIFQDTPSGVVTNLGYARRSGGNCSVLEREPNGTVTGEDGSTILGVEHGGLVPLFTFPGVPQPPYGNLFWLANYAFGTDGTIYADEISGDTGFEQRQLLVAVKRGRLTNLWEQPAPG